MVFQKWGGNAKATNQVATEETTLPTDFPEETNPTKQDGLPDESQVVADDMQLIPKTMLDDILKQLNDLRVTTGTAVDLSKIKNQKKIVRVAFYTSEDGEAEYIVTGLKERIERDGSKRTTWERGRDEFTDKPITWINPIVVDLDTGVKREIEVRYDDFSNLVRVVSIEVDKEVSEQIDTTPKASEGVEVEQATYQEKGGYYKRQGTGIMVQLKSWGIKTVFTITYEGKKYDIDQTVINYK